MENAELLRRMEDLAARCERRSELTRSTFLTPAEQYAVENFSKHIDCTVIFSGGHPDCLRRAAFFLPYYMDEEIFEPEEYISAIKIKACFGEPEHRDYLGTIMGLGIKREWLGDIWVNGSEATVFCLPSVEGHLIASLDKVARYGVKVSKLELNCVEAPERKIKTVTFSVKSPRLDAVCAGMFNLSRTVAAQKIASAEVSLNYSECTDCDTNVHEGDVISVRGFGKGTVGASGGTSKKGRLFMSAEILK